MTFLIRNRGQIINAIDVNQFALALGGTASQQMLWTQWNSTSTYAATVGNVDTTNGLALKVQYDVAGAPSTIALFKKSRVEHAVSTVALAPLAVFGNGTETAGTGFEISATNQALFFEAASISQPSDNSMLIVKTLTGGSNIMIDAEAYVTHSGTVMTSGTASSAAAGTLVVAGTPWVVNAYAGKIVRINSGTGSGQHRLVASNTNNTLTLTSNWTVTPDGTSAYAIVSKGDPANAKLNTYVRDNSVADTRSLEIHTVGSAARGEATLWGIELGVHPGIATTDATDKIVGYVARCTPPSGSSITAPAAPVQGDAAYLAYGDGTTTGWNKYFKGLRKDNVVQVYFSSVASTPAMFLKINGASAASGLWVVKDGAANDTYLSAFVGNDDNGYLQQVVSAGAGSYFVIGGVTTAAGLQVNAMGGTTGNIFEAALTADVRWAIDVNGVPNWIKSTSFGTGSGGAGATLRQISTDPATGPSVAAQSTWVKAKVNGVVKWFAAWDA